MFPKSVFTTVLAIIFSCFSSLWARDIETTAMKILKGSPVFTSEKYGFETLSKNLKTESNLPDPQIDGEYLVLPKDVDNRWSAALSWGLEWPGVYEARGKEAATRLEVASRELYGRRLDRLVEIKKLLLDYILCEKRLVLLKHLVANNDSIYSLAQKAAAGGELTLLDLSKIKLEYAGIKTAKAQIESEQSQIVSDLSDLYGADCSALLSELDTDFPPIQLPGKEMVEKIVNNSSALRIAESATRAAKAARRTTAMENLPSVSLGYKHQFEDGMHFNGGILGITIPSFSTRGKKEAANAAVAEAEFNSQAALTAADNEVNQNIRQLRLIKEQLEEIEPIVKDSNYNTLLLKAFQGRLISLIDYLTERNYFTSAAMEVITLQHSAAVVQNNLYKYEEVIDF